MDESDAQATTRREIASMGGKARAKRVPKERRSEIARAAAFSRHSPNLPFAVSEGEIDFSGRRISCAVLDTKLRVLTQETFLTTLGRAGKAKGGSGSQQLMRVGGLPPFLAAENLQRFISDELRQAATPVVFRTKRGQRAYGYDARLLPLVCEVYLLARDAHLKALRDTQEGRARGEPADFKPVLLPNQEKIVQTCDLLVRSMAKEHIVALVDRASGYQDQEVRDEITLILSAYIAPHLMPWTLRFPDEFFRQVYRLHGWRYEVGNRKMPQYVGKFINSYIYEQLPPGVLDKLQDLNPVNDAGHRATQHHRLLTDTGNVHLDRQITSTITVMQLSDTKEQFKDNFARIHTKAIANKQQVSLRLEAKEDSRNLQLFPDSNVVTPKGG